MWLIILLTILTLFKYVSVEAFHEQTTSLGIISQEIKYIKPLTAIFQI